jgi:hypothetical protein
VSYINDSTGRHRVANFHTSFLPRVEEATNVGGGGGGDDDDDDDRDKAADRMLAGGGACTLHLYSPPIRSVKVYEPNLASVYTRVPGFFTTSNQVKLQPLTPNPDLHPTKSGL